MQDKIDAYLDGPRLLRDACAGISGTQQLARVEPGSWSTLEVVCHLSDMEQVFTERMKRVLVEDRPSLPDADENEYQRALAYHHRNLDEELAVIELLRAHMGRILHNVDAKSFSRVGIHSTAGPLTLEQLLTKVTKHLEHHVEFVRGKRRALGL